MDQEKRKKAINDFIALFKKYKATLWSRRWSCCGQGYCDDLYEFPYKIIGMTKIRDFSGACWGPTDPEITWQLVKASYDLALKNWLSACKRERNAELLFLQDLYIRMRRNRVTFITMSDRAMTGGTDDREDYYGDSFQLSSLTNRFSKMFIEGELVWAERGPYNTQFFERALENPVQLGRRAPIRRMLEDIQACLEKEHAVIRLKPGELIVITPDGLTHRWPYKGGDSLSDINLRDALERDNNGQTEN